MNHNTQNKPPLSSPAPEVIMMQWGLELGLRMRMMSFLAITTILFAISFYPPVIFAEDPLVDKTSFIKAIVEDKHRVLLITRPPNWGKTTNLRELENFLTPNVKSDCSYNTVLETYKARAMYNTVIDEHKGVIESYFGKYPTIFFSLKIKKAGTIEELYKQIALRINKLYQKYPYLSNSPNLNMEEIALFNKYATDYQILTKTEIIESLRFLEDILNKHFTKQTIILIDEYDYLVNKYYIAQFADHDLRLKESPLLLEIYDLVGKMLAKAIKNNQSLHKAVVTGTTNIEKMGVFTDLENFREDSVLNPYMSRYFGFTQNELIGLLKKADIYYDDKVLADIKSWYGGYNIGGTDIYHPTSIVKMINSYKSRRDLVLTHVRYISLSSDFTSPKRQKELLILLNGGSIDIETDPYVEFREIDSSSDSFYTLLVYQGFLAATNIRKNPNGTYRCSVKIPNKEYREIFERARIVKK